MVATVAAACCAKVPAAIHLDHGAGLDSAVRAINYRYHPVHLAFADKKFHSLAGDRIRIDYVAIEDD